MNKRILFNSIIATIIFTISFTVSGADTVSAATVSEIKQQKEQAQQAKNEAQGQLDAVEGDISEISEEKEAVEEEIEELDSLLFDLLIEVDLMKSDIESKKESIAQAEIDLAAAIETEEAQKTAMAKRIKYMYEKGNESYIEILIESKSMAEAVNRVDFTEKLYSYDRMMLEQYQLAKMDVANAKAQLETDLSELEEMEEDLEIQQAELNALIKEKEATVEGFANQLASAKARAAEYEKQIKQQTDNLKMLDKAEQLAKAEEARKKAEEEARKKAEEAARKKAEEDAAKSLAEAKNSSSDKKKDSDSKSSEEKKTDSSDNTDTTADSDKKTDSDSSSNSTSTATTSESTHPGDDSASAQPASTGTSVKATGSGTGTDIANYALQFVGNPYVAGGTSLTEGCDCSGFTQTVYSNFGIKIPRSSYSQSEGGTAVSVDAMQAGDILYYGGHVGIYIGNNQIVHASTPSTGIKVSNAYYRSVITVRRYY